LSYADEAYYTDTYKGVIIPAGELGAFLQRASDEVDHMTMNRVVKVGFEALTVFQQGCLQKAVCAQAEHLYGYKDFLEGVGSFSSGDLSVNFKDYRLSSSRALNYLSPTGLRHRGL
jgi:hypothetical protein